MSAEKACKRCGAPPPTLEPYGFCVFCFDDLTKSPEFEAMRNDQYGWKEVVERFIKRCPAARV